jgi:hypothetical protein
MIYVAPFDSCSGDRVVVFVIMASAEQISSDFPFGSNYVEAPGHEKPIRAVQQALLH